MTGEELYAELLEWLNRNPKYAGYKVSEAVHGTRHLGSLRKTRCCKIETVRKAQAIMRDPPDDLLRCRRARGSKSAEQRSSTVAQRIRKGNRRKALERIEAGLPVGGKGSSAAITCTQRAIEAMVEQNRRAVDPLEQALTRLRRERWTVFRASVYGGRHDYFIIHRRSGDRVVPASEIMRMAERLRV